MAELKGQLSLMVQASSQQQQNITSQLSEQSARMEQTLSNFRQQLGHSLNNKHNPQNHLIILPNYLKD